MFYLQKIVWRHRSLEAACLKSGRNVIYDIYAEDAIKSLSVRIITNLQRFSKQNILKSLHLHAYIDDHDKQNCFLCFGGEIGGFPFFWVFDSPHDFFEYLLRTIESGSRQIILGLKLILRNRFINNFSPLTSNSSITTRLLFSYLVLRYFSLEEKPVVDTSSVRLFHNRESRSTHSEIQKG